MSQNNIFLKRNNFAFMYMLICALRISSIMFPNYVSLDETSYYHLSILLSIST